MIDFSSEALLSFHEASAFLPGRPNLSTLHRWRQRGCRGVKLETCLIGGRRFTSKEALQRFVARTTAAEAGEPKPIRTPLQRQRAIEQAKRELDRAGI